MDSLWKHQYIFTKLLLYMASIIFLNQSFWFFCSFNASEDPITAESYRGAPLPATKSSWLVIANKTNCHSRALHHKVNEYSPPLPSTSLLSLHGSGNSWLRYLIERMTGICTGSVYQEKEMTRLGFHCELGDIRLGTTVVQKSHYLYHWNATKVLFLVRNLLDALVSDFNRISTAGNHTGIAAVSKFSGNEWSSFVVTRTEEWRTQIITTLSSVRNLHVVFYENLKTDLKSQLLRIADFLQVFVGETRMDCVLHNPTGNLKRSHPAKLSRKYFTESQMNSIRSAIRDVIPHFRSRGISDIPKEYIALADG